MKLRYKAPSGGGTVELDDDAATVSQLLDALRASTGYTDVIVKYGWPPRALGADQASATLQSLGLHRESLTVVPDESTSAAAAATAAAETRAAENVADAYARQAPRGIRDQNISVPMPENNSRLVLRVMPDDNSCLFTAVGGALRGLEPQPPGGYTPDALRRLVVEHIRSRPDKFTAVVLEMPPERYCARMVQPDVWGGAIELGILSELFRVEICAVDVKTNGVVRYGEGLGYELRCVLVYSNIHYDRVAEIFVDGQEEMDFDVTRWPTSADAGGGGGGDGTATAMGDYVLIHAQELCRKLRDEHHYYTDTSDFVVMCNQCGWVGQGQKALARHSLETGHTEISEIEDTTA
ncbi:hypothetical protein F4809DRAFT_427265 [Biscogniauxia mediterranea]|nr:hypothetical protein F4809DRAFT_427265 [Biscogniauxia mediterranea]